MASFDQMWQSIAFPAFVVVWVGVGIAILVRAFAEEFTYLRRFPPVDGTPLNRFASPIGQWNVVLAQWRVLLQPQRDPEMESLRRQGYRYLGAFVAWVIISPMLFLCVSVLLLVVERAQHATY